MLSPEASVDLRNKLKAFIEETEREVIAEEIESDLWKLEFKNGIYTVNAFHRLGYTSVQIISYFTFDFAKNQLEIFRDIYSSNNDRFLFDYGLRVALTSPYTFYYIDYKKIGEDEDVPTIPGGFYVGIRLFPNDKAFSINLLEHSIQNIISVVSLVQTYIATSLQSGEALITYRPDNRPPPDIMYGN